MSRNAIIRSDSSHAHRRAIWLRQLLGKQGGNPVAAKQAAERCAGPVRVSRSFCSWLSILWVSYLRRQLMDRFRLAGVMGWPVMHSRSPVLHNYWFRRYGLQGTCVPLAIEPQGLEAALRALAPLGFAGCNLTIPHKQRAITMVDEVDPVAKRIGAISCVIVRPDDNRHQQRQLWLRAQHHA